MKKTVFKIALGLSLYFTSFILSGQEIANPKIKWRFKTQGPVRGAAVVSERNIYFGSSDGTVRALRKEDGALIWKRPTGGAITSVPALAGKLLYIANRDNRVYALDTDTGRIRWQFRTQPILPDFHAGWEYFMAAPVVSGGQVLVGSGDGHLYSLDAGDGALLWKFKTNGRIRATPLVEQGVVYQPSNDGYVYALELASGRLLWKFETRGATYDPKDFNFDRSSICTQPIIKDNTLFFGSRDGNTYAVDLGTHREKWSFSYGTTWAMATTISDDMIFVGWSTNNLSCALDLNTGKEKWQFKSEGHVYTKPLVLDSGVYIGSADGKVYHLDKTSGEKVWEYPIGREIYSSIIHDDGTIFFGSDDGFFYALEEGNAPHKVVYQPPKIEGNAQFVVVDRKIAPYLVEKGFEQLDDAGLYGFIVDRIADKNPSVVVFSFPIVPRDVMGERPAQGLLRQYLENGGKVIWLGDVPNFYEEDRTGNFKRDPTTGAQLLGVTYEHATDSGNYFSNSTQEGLNQGLPRWLKTTGAIVAPEGVVPLAKDEFGRINAWMKKFHPRPGSGFVSCRTWAWNVPIKKEDLELINQLAIFALE